MQFAADLQIGSPAETALQQDQHTRYRHSMIVAVSAIVMYLPTLKFGFVNWDDPWYVLNNPLIRSWSWDNLTHILTRPAVRNYAPLTQISYLLQHSLFGDWAGGYHFVNFMLHAVNSVLVYHLMTQLAGRRDLALLTATVFAIHPVHVESVAWISSHKGLLATAFILASLLCWCRPHRTPRHELLAVTWLTLALAAKVIAVMIPPVLLCYDVLVRRDEKATALTRQFLPGLIGFWFLLRNVSAQSALVGGVRSHLELSKLQILALDQAILWKYVGMLLFPHNLNVLYSPAIQGQWAVLAIAGLGWLAVCVAAWRYRRAYPKCVWALISFFLLLLPVLNLFPLTTLMNDRYLYLPSIAFFGAVICGGAQMMDRLRRHSRQSIQRLAAASAVGLMAIALTAYAGVTVRQRMVWRSGVTLWSHALEQTPQLAIVRFQLALVLHEQGRTQAALELLQSALQQCEPDEIDRQRIEKQIEKLRSSRTMAAHTSLTSG